MTKPLAVCAIAAAMFAGAANAPLHAQECTGEGARTEWFERAVMNGSDPVAAADLAAIEPRLAQFEDLVRKTAFGSPRGFEAYPSWHYGAPPDRARLSWYAFVLVLQCPSRKATGGDGQLGIVINVNPDPQMWSESDRPHVDAKGDSIYINKVRGATRFGATALFGDLDLESITGLGAWVLFTTGDASPTLPVSREEYLRLVLFEVEGPPGAKAKSAYQEYLDGAPDRKKANDEVVAIVAKSDPAKAEQLRKDLEKAERENGELLKQSDEQGAAGLRASTDRIRAQIAAMTPAERAAPAYIVGFTDFVEADAPNAMAVVRRNPALYRARTSPFEPRLIVVRLPGNYSALNDLNRRVHRELDWAALKALVNSRDP